jgi:hypothetical protein
MNESAEMLALRKRLLLARCGLCRLQLRTGASALREHLSWRNAGFGALKALPILGLGLALAAMASRTPTPEVDTPAPRRLARLAAWLVPLISIAFEIS